MANRPPPPMAQGDVDAYDYDANQTFDDDESAKRRRIARACDMCRKKKIRCDGANNPCTNCAAYHTECIFTEAPKKRAPPRGAKYIQSLEERLEKMESMLRQVAPLAGLNSPIDRTTSAKAETVSLSTPKQSTTDPDNFAAGTTSQLQSDDEADDELVERMGLLVPQGNGGPRYMGAPSTLTMIMSANKRIRDILGDESFDDFLRKSGQHLEAEENDTLKDDLQRDGWHHLKPQALRVPKPSICQLYIDAYFDRFQQLWPVLDREIFQASADELHKDNQANLNETFCATYLLVLAFGCYIIRRVDMTDRSGEPYSYFSQSQVYKYSMVHAASLENLQCLILTSMYLDTLSRDQTFHIVIGVAARVGYAIGVHRKLPVYNVVKGDLRSNEKMTEIRKRVFWVLYIMDAKMVRETGMPATLNDLDCDQELPSFTKEDERMACGLKYGDGTPFSFFHSQIELAKISHECHRRLYSVGAVASLSREQVSEIIEELDRRLLSWLSNMPAPFQPEFCLVKGLDTSSQNSQLPLFHTNALIPHSIVKYFNLTMTIHRRKIRPGPSTGSTPQSFTASPAQTSRQLASGTIAVQAARTSLSLALDTSPLVFDDSILRANLAYLNDAAMMLFSNLVRNPCDAEAEADMALLENVNSVFTRRLRPEGRVLIMRKIFQELISFAQMVLLKANAKGTKRSQQDMDDEIRETVPTHSPIAPLESYPALFAGMSNFGGINGVSQDAMFMPSLFQDVPGPFFTAPVFHTSPESAQYISETNPNTGVVQTDFNPYVSSFQSGNDPYAQENDWQFGGLFNGY